MSSPISRRDAIKTLALAGASLALARAADAHPHDEVAKPKAVATPAAGAAAPAATGPFTLPPLPYAVDALEPHIDAQTMSIHHDKHHAAYVANLNKAVDGRPEVGRKFLEELLTGIDKLPADLAKAVRNQGGGHINHSMFWTSLSKSGARAPSAELRKAIATRWNTFESFQTEFNAAALGVFGSGWAWLVLDAKQNLDVITLPNQDSPLMTGLTPLLGLDVWEHAYYLKYQNRRADYIAALAQVVDWDVITARYVDAVGGH